MSTQIFQMDNLYRLTVELDAKTNQIIATVEYLSTPEQNFEPSVGEPHQLEKSNNKTV